ncbi:MAG: putrescine ABC transporter permease PotH, partial [Xanthomonadales bacterium]|nr:putrescine ABC transporter permease PotH [Xanthomonadales bacterium]
MSARTGGWRRFVPGARWGLISIPYFWLLLFFAIPFLIALKISFAKAAIAMPPYTDILYWVDGFPILKLRGENYLFLAGDSIYVNAYLSSLKIAIVSTLLCLAIGYPMAYAISRMSPATRNIALLLVILP